MKQVMAAIVLILLLLIPIVSANSVYYPGKGNGSGTFNTYTGVTCTNLGGTSPCARYDEGSLRVDMDRYSVKYQVQNNQGQWRWIKYIIPNPTDLIPTPVSNPKSLVWNNMYANNTSLRYVMQPHGIKLGIWGNGTPPNNYFNFTYSLSANVTYRMQGAEILFMDTVTGEPLWLVKYPTMQVNGTDIPITFKKDGNNISIHAPGLFTAGYNFSSGWELDPSTQSENTIYISDRSNLTQVSADISNATALSNVGTVWSLNANLINNNTANRFFMNYSEVTDLRINSTHTNTENITWYYLTNGQTEVQGINDTARVNITSWNSTTNAPEDLPVSTWTRSAMYASGESSKMNFSWANASNLGYNAPNLYGISYITSSENSISHSLFLQNFRGIYLYSSSNNNLHSNTGTSNTNAGIGLYTSSNNNTLTSNIGTSNTSFAIYLLSSSNNNLTSNTGTSNTSYGIILSTSSNNNTLTSNTGSSNTNIGIYLITSSNNNTLTSNTGTSNINVGIYLSSSSNNNNLTSNTGSSDTSIGIYLFSSPNNNLTSNTGTSNTSYGIYLSSSSNNNLTSNTGTSNASYGIYLSSSSNNNLTSNTFNTNSTTTTVADMLIRDSYSNNTFRNTNFSKPRKISLYDNVSRFNMSQDNTSFVSTQNIGTASITLTTNRSIINWTQLNVSFSETWTEAKQIRYNVSGLYPNTTYHVWNGSVIDYTYTTDAGGILTPFTINFTTTIKPIKILKVSASVIVIPANSWGMFNNWSVNTNFSSIETNESNDVTYTFYNVTSGEWDSYYPGYSWNADQTINKNHSVLGFFNAQTNITANTVTPWNTSITEGWNMLYLMGSTNRTLTEICTNMVNCTDIYYYNSTTNDYVSTGTDTIQPNQGFLAYVNRTETWIRSTI